MTVLLKGPSPLPEGCIPCRRLTLRNGFEIPALYRGSGQKPDLVLPLGPVGLGAVIAGNLGTPNPVGHVRPVSFVETGSALQ